jgi:molecular chaperone GrpE
MDKRVKVPIRVKSSSADAPGVKKDGSPAIDRDKATLSEPAVGPPRSATQGVRSEKQASKDEYSLEAWRDRALRLQAEMENFRKRQQRLGDERISADRERLLRAFLGVADDLERALQTDGTDTASLRKGVELTHRSLVRILDREGAEPIEAAGQPFDPAWHEAVGTVPYRYAGVEPDTVVEVVEPGYRLGDRLLRPARVIVAT